MATDATFLPNDQSWFITTLFGFQLGIFELLNQKYKVRTLIECYKMTRVTKWHKNTVNGDALQLLVELDNMQEVQTRISGSHVGELSKHQSLFVGA